MSKEEHIISFPFTEKQLLAFKYEIEEAGSFEELMIDKEALVFKEGLYETVINENQKEYKKKFLVGIYKPLRQFYDTDMPYSFWTAFHRALEKSAHLLK